VFRINFGFYKVTWPAAKCSSSVSSARSRLPFQLSYVGWCKIWSTLSKQV